MSSGSVRIQAVAMSNVNIAAYSASGGIANVYSNGRLQTPVRFGASGAYTFQIRASGTPLQGVYPQVSLMVDGTAVKTLFVNSQSFQIYTITATIAAGTHNIALAFINDASSATEDRNVAFDYLVITPARPLRISALRLDSEGSARLVWDSDTDSTYQVYYSDDPASGSWLQAGSITSTGTAASWLDDATLGAPRRFYRLQRAGP
jgi:hypothetical protein